MKNPIKFIVLAVTIILFYNCSSDDNGYNSGGVDPASRVKVYTLNTGAVSNISGTATFTEQSDLSLTVEINLSNTPVDGLHPAHIHFNTAVETGGIALTLNAVDGASGSSSTNFSTLDDGTQISYDDLLEFNGYINVHLSADELATIVAQGDIGGNELTGQVKSYDLSEADLPGVQGTAVFAERANGTSLLTLSLEGTSPGAVHPAHIHENDVLTTGVILVGLNPVNGDTGVSETQISQTLDGTTLNFDDILSLNAYINVHLSQDDLSTIAAQGNIGSNEDEPIDITNFEVTNNGASSYVFNGGGFSNQNNPTLNLERGKTYEFDIDTPGHPFYIKTIQGVGSSNAYNNGVVNNGTVNGVIRFTVPNDAPNTLFYNCEFHGSMTGTVFITD
jgi:hypothetical protein